MLRRMPPPPPGKPPPGRPGQPIQPQECFDPCEIKVASVPPPSKPKAPPRGYEGVCVPKAPLVVPKAPPSAVAPQPEPQTFRNDVDDQSEPEVVSGDQQQRKELHMVQQQRLHPSVFGAVKAPLPTQFQPPALDCWNPAHPPGDPSWFSWNSHLEMWYCKLCDANATEGHLASAKHQKRSAYPEHYLPCSSASTPFSVKPLQALTDSSPEASAAGGCLGASPCGYPPRPSGNTPTPWCTNAVSSTVAATAASGLPSHPSCPPPRAMGISSSVAATSTPDLEAAPPSAAPVAPPVVPPGWRTFWDPEAEKFYYWQTSTNLVQWDHPQAADLKLPVPEPQQQPQQQKQQQYAAHMQPQPAYMPYRQPPLPSDPVPQHPAPLPPGWTFAMDSNNKPYYYLVENGKVTMGPQWDRP